jgi:hypothetical protein
MNHGKRLVFRSVVGLSLGFVGLTGCDSETSSTPVTSGIGVAGKPGPVSSKMPKRGAAGKTNPARPGGTNAPSAPKE